MFTVRKTSLTYIYRCGRVVINFNNGLLHHDVHFSIALHAHPVLPKCDVETRPYHNIRTCVWSRCVCTRTTEIFSNRIRRSPVNEHSIRRGFPNGYVLRVDRVSDGKRVWSLCSKLGRVRPRVVPKILGVRISERKPNTHSYVLHGLRMRMWNVKKNGKKKIAHRYVRITLKENNIGNIRFGENKRKNVFIK